MSQETEQQRILRENTIKRKNFWEEKLKKENSEFNSIYNMPFKVLDKLSLWMDANDNSRISVGGRITKKRQLGKISFLKIFDYSAEVQLILKEDTLEDFEGIIGNLAIGDMIAVEGIIVESKTGERSIQVEKIQMIACNYRETPDKWHGINDIDFHYRNTYMSFVYDENFRKTINLRIQIMALIREFFQKNGFLEVETPILQHIASGAAAKPFKTHHDALDIDLFLRIAPELSLKTMIAAGYTKIFEIGKNFRNEGIDPTHLQEFTMLECYAAYWEYSHYMNFTKELFLFLINKLQLSTRINFRGYDIELNQDWKVENFSELINKITGININDIDNLKDNIIKYMQENKIDINLIKNVNTTMGLVDFLYKKMCRPNIIQPTFMIGYPSYMAPLATEKNNISTKLQLVIAGIEFINSYGELVDPIQQDKNFREQEEYQKNLKLNKFNDEADDIFAPDDNFLQAMKYGMPPMAGYGLGIDRLIVLFSNNDNLKNTIILPLVIN